MQDDIGLVIAKGLSVVYKERPDNAVDFFAKWLLQQADIKNKKLAEIQMAEQVNKLKEKEEWEQRRIEKAAEEVKVQEQEKQAKIDAFNTLVKGSDDLADNLQALVEHLHEFTGATSVYVGKLDKPIKGFSQGLAEDDDDEAHIIPKAETEIQFQHADKDHQFLVDQVLQQQQGITYQQLFAKADEEEVGSHQLPKSIVIDEIVREPKMHYYQVPRLGSYMAIKLVYNSCLFEDAYDDAIANYEAVNQFKKDQAQEKVDWQNQQDEIAREKQELGEEYEPEEKTWPEYSYADFKTQPVEYVVCLNTMGQDR